MPNVEAALLDTHVVLWWKAGGHRLSAMAVRQIAAAKQLLISPLSCWEVAMLVAKDRVRLDRPIRTWVDHLLADERISLAAVSPSGAVAAGGLDGFHGDPVDRFLVATAGELRVPLITKDRLIRSYATEHGGFDVIW